MLVKGTIDSGNGNLEELKIHTQLLKNCTGIWAVRASTHSIVFGPNKRRKNMR